MKDKIKNVVARGFIVRFGIDAKWHKKEAEWLVDEIMQLFSDYQQSLIEKFKSKKMTPLSCKRNMNYNKLRDELDIELIAFQAMESTTLEDIKELLAKIVVAAIPEEKNYDYPKGIIEDKEKYSKDDGWNACRKQMLDSIDELFEWKL